MASNPQILSDLRVIQEADHQIELLTTYKGVPFICRAKIERIQEGRVLVRAEDPSMVCLKADRKPRVLGSDYFEPSVASVISIDIHTGEIELDNFTYVGTKLGERMIVRVEPRDTIPVTLQTEVQETTGQLADISINGIGVHIARSAYDPTFKPGTIVQTRFKLATGEIGMSGTVLSAFKMDLSYRISIRFNDDGSQKILIFKYLVDRRVEIENELISNFQAALSSPRN